jgi:hypothetical protein
MDLLAVPTDALRRVRRKAEAGRVLSRTEWTVVAHFGQHGMETVAMANPNRLSTESLMAVLDAFAAVYDMRQEPDTRQDAYYLGNLPVECRPAAVTDEAPISEAVRTAVAETRRRLRERAPRCLPWLAARNLRVLLAEDRLPGAAVIHRALRPHWPVLWRLAVHGHNALTGETLPDVPCRDAREADARRNEPRECEALLRSGSYR